MRCVCSTDPSRATSERARTYYLFRPPLRKPEPYLPPLNDRQNKYGSFATRSRSTNFVMQINTPSSLLFALNATTSGFVAQPRTPPKSSRPISSLRCRRRLRRGKTRMYVCSLKKSPRTLLMRRAWSPICMSAISPSSSARGTSAATLSTTTMSTAFDRTSWSTTSSAISP